MCECVCVCGVCGVVCVVCGVVWCGVCVCVYRYAPIIFGYEQGNDT